MANIYSYENYKKYLSHALDEMDRMEKGARSRLARAVRCQASYVSQVLNGKPNFTPEQAHCVSRFLGHTKDESRYFQLLVEYARAATSDLQNFLLDQIREKQKARFDLKKRLKETEEIPESARQKYYSTWYIAAIHMGLGVPSLRAPRKLARHLNIPEQQVFETIEFLKECGLIKEEKGHYEFTKRSIHLERDSPFIQVQHINFRSLALQSVEKNSADDLHYSLLFCLSEEDFLRVREVIVAALESVNKVIVPSPSEKLCALTLDLFNI